MTITKQLATQKELQAVLLLRQTYFLLSLFIAYAIHPVYSLCILLSLSDLC